MGRVECRLGPRGLQAEGTARLGLFLERAMWVSRGDNKECGPIKHYCSPGGFRAQQMIRGPTGLGHCCRGRGFFQCLSWAGKKCLALMETGRRQGDG